MFSPICTTLTQLEIICHLLTCMTPGFEPITVLDMILWLWYMIPSVSFLRKPDTIKPSIKCLLQEKFTSWHNMPVISWYGRWKSHPSFFVSFLLLTESAIGGIVGGVIAVVVILVVLIVYCYKKSKTKRKAKDEDKAETKVFLETQSA